MCDFSLHNVKSRPAKVGDKLTTHSFYTGTRGFAAPEDFTTAVCILPGTELAFSAEVICAPSGRGVSGPAARRRSGGVAAGGGRAAAGNAAGWMAQHQSAQRVRLPCRRVPPGQG
jgi:hypothetical protein